MDSLQVIASLLIGLSFFAGIVKWGISSYFEKVKELDEIKANQIRSIINELSKTAQELEKRMDRLEETIRKVDLRLIQFEYELRSECKGCEIYSCEENSPTT